MRLEYFEIQLIVIKNFTNYFTTQRALILSTKNLYVKRNFKQFFKIILHNSHDARIV